MNTLLNELIWYANRIIENFRDPYHGSPLFFDGCNSVSGQPVEWINSDGQSWEVSNIASQQNLFRFFAGLSVITGDDKYVAAAKSAIQWHFDHSDSSGLVHWGGHCFIDMKTLVIVGPENKRKVHELKHHCPFYELMYETDATATEKLIKSIWNSHVTDWDTLEMSRHGQFGLDFDAENLWKHKQTLTLEPLREMNGLSFVNIGNDLTYAAGMMYSLTNDTGALSWANFLMRQYVESRHPETQLGCYQYNRPAKKGEPPLSEDHPQYTFSFWGDRAQRQFGAEYGDVAKEAWVLFKMDEEALNGPEGIYGDCAYTQTVLARRLGQSGQQLLQWTTEGLEAWAHYAYDAQTNEIKPMFADGKDLTGKVIPRTGYYGKAGLPFIRRKLPPHVFLAYVTNWAVCRSEKIYDVVCQMAKHFDLGDWQECNLKVNLETENDGELFLFAALEMHKSTNHGDFLKLAHKLGANIRKRSYHRGLYLKSKQHAYCRFDDVTPLALLSLVAAERGCADAIPEYRSQGGYIHGEMKMSDGSIKNTMDVKDIYNQLC
ncbi:pectate lyase [Reinekea sp. G2M2-21]|uniref:pectate lyase n=1 Tax=Reinekea sp. G2M2-21 TaxID=2788942 RepID=UPI0018AAF3DF|nr:pectate lyase [Reinekea sp. G2M2-21]